MGTIKVLQAAANKFYFLVLGALHQWLRALFYSIFNGKTSYCLVSERLASFG